MSRWRVGNATGEPALLAGALVVALGLGATRWGSYLGSEPLFLSDLLIAAALANAVIRRLRGGAEVRARSMLTPRPSAVFIVFMAYVVLRGAASLGDAPVMVWLRDLAPFAYGIVAFLSAAALATSGPEARRRTARLLEGALVFHAAWLTLAVVLGRPEGLFELPGIGGLPIFMVRADVDVAYIGVTVAVMVRHLAMGRRPVSAIAALALCVLPVGAFTSRAGQVAVLLAGALGLVLALAATRRDAGRQATLIIAIPVILIGALAFLPQTVAGERIAATIGLTDASSSAAANAIGTANARSETWANVNDWTLASPVRTVVGTGFGPDFIRESGSSAVLEGTRYENVRSPHNWFVGVFARLGLMGVLLAGAVVLQLAWMIWRHRRTIADDDVLTIAACVVVAVLPVATVGVVLESPFGAIPFFWSAGLIMALAPPRAGHSRHGAAAREPEALSA